MWATGPSVLGRSKRSTISAGSAALRASDEVELVVAVHGVFHLLDERALNAPAGRGRRNGSECVKRSLNRAGGYAGAH